MVSSSNDTSNPTSGDEPLEETSKPIDPKQVQPEAQQEGQQVVSDMEDSFETILENARALKAKTGDNYLETDITEEKEVRESKQDKEENKEENKEEDLCIDAQLIGLEDLPTEIDEHWNHFSTETMELDESHTTSLPSPSFTDEDSVDLEEWGQLHPYSLLINLLPQMGRTLQNAWPLLLFIIVGGNQAHQVIDSIFVLFFVALSVIRTLIHFLTLRYRVQDGKLILKMGLIFRQARTLDPARIQNIEITQNLLHKYFDLVELKLETAGDASTKGLLSALSLKDATQLKKALQKSKRQHQYQDNEHPAEAVLSLSWGEVLLFGLSRRTVGTVVVLSAIASEALSVMNPNDAQQMASSLTLPLFIGLMSISFAFSWIWSSIQATLRYHKLKLHIDAEEINIVSGLITKRSVEIPRHKIQTIEWFEPWLRRQMGFGTLYLETAALGMTDGEVRRSEGVIPMVERQYFARLLETIAPTSASEILNAKTYTPHSKARFIIVFGYLVPAICTMAFAWWSLELSAVYFSIVAVLSTVVVLGLTELDFQMQQWSITPHAILSRSGYLNKRTWLLDREKIQCVYRTEDPLLKILGLSQVVLQVAGSAVYLPLITEHEAQQVLHNLTEDWAEVG